MGYDSFQFSRIDYQDMAARKASRTLQMLWRASDLETTPANTIWTNVMDDPEGYSYPGGFSWEIPWSADPPIMDDPLLDENNVKDRVDAFLAYIDRVVRNACAASDYVTVQLLYIVQIGRTVYGSQVSGTECGVMTLRVRPLVLACL